MGFIGAFLLGGLILILITALSIVAVPLSLIVEAVKQKSLDQF